MKYQVDHRAYVALETKVFVKSPLEMPELVKVEDPATYVFTDFTHNMPAIIGPEVSIDKALNRMRKSAVRLLLVVDKDEAVETASSSRPPTVIGQITSCDILGEAPVRIAQSSGMRHSEITVNMVMTPRKDIDVVEWSHIKNAKVGHVLATMHHRQGCHILVSEEGMIRGIFSMSEISRHLGHDESEPLMCANSLSELVHETG